TAGPGGSSRPIRLPINELRLGKDVPSVVSTAEEDGEDAAPNIARGTVPAPDSWIAGQIVAATFRQDTPIVLTTSQTPTRVSQLEGSVGDQPWTPATR